MELVSSKCCWWCRCCGLEDLDDSGLVKDEAILAKGLIWSEVKW